MTSPRVLLLDSDREPLAVLGRVLARRSSRRSDAARSRVAGAASAQEIVACL